MTELINELNTPVVDHELELPTFFWHLADNIACKAAKTRQLTI